MSYPAPRLLLRVSTVVIAGVLCTCCGPGTDIDAERGTLLELDRSWSVAASSRDMERIFSYWTDDAVIYPAGRAAVRSKAAIREFVADNRARPGFSIRWEPHEAAVSQAGDLGYTVGVYEISNRGADGATLVMEGRYLSAWRKDGEGAWRCALVIHAPLGRS